MLDGFATAKRAERKMRRADQSYTAAFIDFHLPPESGFTAAGMVRGIHAGLSIFVVSGHVSNALVHMVAECSINVSGVIEKPLSAIEFCDLIIRNATET